MHVWLKPKNLKKFLTETIFIKSVQCVPNNSKVMTFNLKMTDYSDNLI